jgi:2,5-diketo-D-gluconate reductase A
VAVWSTLVELRLDQRARSIGVSNFDDAQLCRLVAETGVAPAVNQIEVHPYLAQSALREANKRYGVVTEAWSPLGNGTVLSDPTLVSIAGRIGRSPAQVVLRWHVQRGDVAIPKTRDPERARENFDCFDFALGEDDMALINSLDRNRRTGPDPATFN